MLQSFLLFSAVIAAHLLIAALPDREEAGPAAVELRMEPLDLGLSGFGPFRLAGAWTVTADDPRMTGISAIAARGSWLLSLTDSGVLARLAKPGAGSGRALLDELPAGPGSAGFKRNRDSEALLRDPLGRGWWVAFEYRNEIWLYDSRFERAIKRLRLLGTGWGRNAGIEAVAADGDTLLLIPEVGTNLLQLDGNLRVRSFPLRGLRGRVSDAARLPGGGLLLIERRVTPFGFANALVRVTESDGAYRVRGRTELPLGPLYNVEGISLEQLPNGALRIWLVTDDGHEARAGAALIALDVAAPGSAQPR